MRSSLGWLGMLALLGACGDTPVDDLLGNTAGTNGISGGAADGGGTGGNEHHRELHYRRLGKRHG